MELNTLNRQAWKDVFDYPDNRLWIKESQVVVEGFLFGTG